MRLVKPLLALVTVSAATAGAVWYSHAAQVEQRRRMHAGVLRDIAQEQRAAAAAAATSDCEGGVCDLKVTRFRDPATGALAPAPQAAAASSG
jgi:hypothetical protein